MLTTSSFQKEEKILELKRRLDSKSVQTQVTFHSSLSGGKCVTSEASVSGPTGRGGGGPTSQILKPGGGGILKSPRLVPKQHRKTASFNRQEADSPSQAASDQGIQLTVINTNYRPQGQSPPQRPRKTHLIEASLDSGLASSVFSSSLGTTRTSRLSDDVYREDYC